MKCGDGAGRSGNRHNERTEQSGNKHDKYKGKGGTRCMPLMALPWGYAPVATLSLALWFWTATSSLSSMITQPLVRNHCSHHLDLLLLWSDSLRSRSRSCGPGVVRQKYDLSVGVSGGRGVNLSWNSDCDASWAPS